MDPKGSPTAPVWHGAPNSGCSRTENCRISFASAARICASPNPTLRFSTTYRSNASFADIMNFPLGLLKASTDQAGLVGILTMTRIDLFDFFCCFHSIFWFQQRRAELEKRVAGFAGEDR